MYSGYVNLVRLLVNLMLVMPLHNMHSLLQPILETSIHCRNPRATIHVHSTNCQWSFTNPYIAVLVNASLRSDMSRAELVDVRIMSISSGNIHRVLRCPIVVMTAWMTLTMTSTCGSHHTSQWVHIPHDLHVYGASEERNMHIFVPHIGHGEWSVHLLWRTYYDLVHSSLELL